MPDFNHMTYLNVSLLLFSALVSFFLLFGVLMSRVRNRLFLRKAIALLLAQMVMQLGEAGIWYWNGNPANAWLIKLCCFLSFGMGLVVTTLFVYCFVDILERQGRVNRLPVDCVAGLCVVGFALIVVSFFNGIFFDVNAAGYFIDGPYAHWVSYLDITNFAVIVLFVFYYRQLLTLRGFGMLLIYCGLHLGAILLEDIWYPVPLYLASTLALMVMLNFFYEALAEEYLEKEKELMESRITLM
ncbi:MAG: hypothetical protein ACI3WS_06450, partial [Phascolarctobacterium sp.]